MNPDGTHGPEQERRAEELMAIGPVKLVRRIMELEDALDECWKQRNEYRKQRDMYWDRVLALTAPSTSPTKGLN